MTQYFVGVNNSITYPRSGRLGYPGAEVDQAEFVGHEQTLKSHVEAGRIVAAPPVQQDGGVDTQRDPSMPGIDLTDFDAGRRDKPPVVPVKNETRKAQIAAEAEALRKRAAEAQEREEVLKASVDQELTPEEAVALGLIAPKV